MFQVYIFHITSLEVSKITSKYEKRRKYLSHRTTLFILFYTALTTFENLSGQEMGCWSDVFIVNFEQVDIGWGETRK